MKKLFVTLLSIILFISCSNDNNNENYLKKESDDFVERRQEIKEIIKSHSRGLDFFYNKTVKDNIIRSNNDENIYDPGLISVDYDYIKNNVKDFLINEKLNEEDIKYLSLLSDDFNLDKTVDLSEYGFEFSKEFYTLSLKVINTKGNSFSEVESKQNELLNSVYFKNLSKIEQNIILLGSETFLDSYKYWDNKINAWEPMVYNYRQIKMNDENYKSYGFWKTVVKYAKADGKGAIAGGIGGAIAGAIAGGIGGAGAGAIPGAIQGAIGGAISTGVANSILVALDYEEPIDDEIILDNGITIPKSWNKIVIDKNIELIDRIKYIENDFVVEFKK